MKKVIGLLAVFTSFTLSCFSQTDPVFHPLENQRLSTGNDVSFKSLSINATGTFTVATPGTSLSGSSIGITSPNGYPGLVMVEGNGSGAARKRWDLTSYAGNFKIFDNSLAAERFFINGTSGNIGIGTAFPSYKLHIAAGNNDGILVGHYNDRLGWDGTGEQPGYHIRFAGYRDLTSNFTGARISALRTNACCNGLSTGMELAFYTSPSASQTGDANLVERMRLKSNGYVGIGTNNPSGILHLNSSYPTVFLTTNDPTLTSSAAAIRGNNAAWLFGYAGSSGNEDVSIGTQDGSGARTLSLAAGGKLRMKILANGYIGIGTSLPQSELAVKGTITSQKVKVTMEDWADYVFDSSYQLASLSQVESFIKENKHLPEVPSALEVKKDGLDLGDNQAVLLKKIEELTLYIIQQNKEMNEMKKELGEVKAVLQNSGHR